MSNVNFYILLIAALFTSSWAYPQNWDWITSGGSVNNDWCSDLCRDHSGNIIAVGSHAGNATFGNLSLSYSNSSTNDQDIFIVKYNVTGTALWAKKITGSDSQSISGVEVDSLGNIYVVGNFYDEINFGSTTYGTVSSSSPDGFIAKYSPSGNFLWFKSMYGQMSVSPTDIKTDAQGNSFVVGNFKGTMALGSGVSHIAQDDRDGFLLKYDTNGVLVWSRTISGLGRENINTILLNEAGEIFINGRFTESLNLGLGQSVASAGGYDVFVAKYNPFGTLVWGKHFESPQNLFLPAIGTNKYDGGVWVAGFATDNLLLESLNLGISGLTPGTADTYLLKIDATGQLAWSQQRGLPLARKLAIDEQGLIYSTGIFDTPFVTGTDTFETAGGYDIFITGYDSIGNPNWTHTAGGPFYEQVSAITFSDNTNLLVGGSFQGQINFDGQLVYGGERDMFIASLNPGQASLAALPSPCENASPFVLSGGSPGGGVYSGPGIVNDSLFDPTLVGPGTFTITYTVNGISVSAPISILGAPNIQMPTLDAVCSNDFPFLLGGASPSGGIFYGPGVSNQIFDPAVSGPGQHSILYTYSDNNGCQSTGTVLITVDTIPDTPQIIPVGVDSLKASVQAPAYQWYLNGQLIPLQTNPIHVQTSGNYQVKAIGSGCESEISSAFLFSTTHLHSPIEREESVSAYPNPFLHTINVTLPASLTLGAHIQILNYQGQAVISRKLLANEIHTQKSILTLQDIPSGYYQLCILDSGNIITHTIISKQ